MKANKMFQILVLGGATLTGTLMGCPGPLGTADAGNEDGGDDGGTCVCQPSTQGFGGQDCAPAGQTFVCCWNHPTAACCPH